MIPPSTKVLCTVNTPYRGELFVFPESVWNDGRRNEETDNGEKQQLEHMGWRKKI